MTDLRSQLQGLWLPLVTPFRDGEVDEASLRRLARHYATGPVDGLILAATSGEGMTLGIAELERVVALVARRHRRRADATLPICLGLSGASTSKMQDTLDETAAWPIDGYLIASPYYLRPSQRGLLQHFTALADHAAWPIVLYNIPYRTAVNLDERDAAAARRTSEHRRPEGLLRRPRAVDRTAPPAAGRLSGPDRRGRAILRSAHRRRRRRHPAVGPHRDRHLRAVRTQLREGNRDAACARWESIAELTRLLFAEPSPAPAKYWLARSGLIERAEVRLPMVEVGAELAGAARSRRSQRRTAASTPQRPSRAPLWHPCPVASWEGWRARSLTPQPHRCSIRLVNAR